MNKQTSQKQKKEIEPSEITPTLGEMFRFVFGTVLKRRSLLIINVMALTIITLLQFVVPQIEQYLIDHVIPKHNYQQLFWSIGILMLAASVLGIFTYLSSYYMSVMSQDAITDLRTQLYRQILQQDTAFFESSKTGDLMTRLTSDINNLQSLISANMLNMVGNIFTFFGVLALIFWINWQMALAVSVTFPLMFAVYRFFRTRIRNATRRARVSQAKMANQMQQTLTQIDLIKSYTSEPLENERFTAIADRNKKDMITAGRNQAIFSPLIDFISTLGIATILLLGAVFIMNGALSIGQLVAYITYVGMAQTPIKAMARLLNQLQQALVSYGRIREIDAERPSIFDTAASGDFPLFHSAISLDHVNFNYNTQPTLREVSFVIPAGKTTALVGRSGSGKTTITRLLARLYEPEGGSIKYDDVPIQQIRLASLRKNISIVSQDIYIIDGTIRDNVVYGRPDADDEAVWQALRLADLASYVYTLPDRLATAVGERGVKLSGGQKQRVAIARALLKDAPIIILDEATASLDNESEKAIQHALDNLMAQRTALVIAHRLSTVQHADQIIVLEAGRVVERGTHNSLLQAGGTYAQLYKIQFE